MATIALRVTEPIEPAVARPRLAYIDNLRVLFISLVILVHLAITYGSPVGSWYYSEKGSIGMVPAILMTIFIAVCQAFIMGFFFLLASYFLPGSADRKGARACVAERLKRLGIPLVFYAIFVNPVLEYAKSVHEGFAGTYPRYAPNHFQNMRTFGVGPLWFVEALLLFSLVYGLWRYLAGTRPVISRRSRVPSNRVILLAALALGTVAFAARIWAPVGSVLQPFNFQLAHFPQYIALFVVGLVAYRRGWLAALEDAQARPWRWAMIPLALVFPVFLVAGGALDGNTDALSGGLHWQSLAYAVWEQLVCVAMVIGLLAWFRDHLNDQGRLLRAIGGDTYAVFVCTPRCWSASRSS